MGHSLLRYVNSAGARRGSWKSSTSLALPVLIDGQKSQELLRELNFEDLTPALFTLRQYLYRNVIIVDVSSAQHAEVNLNLTSQILKSKDFNKILTSGLIIIGTEIGTTTVSMRK